MKLKIIFFAAAMACLGIVADAKSVDETTALTVATNFYARNSQCSLESLHPVIAYTAVTNRGVNGSAPGFYVVNFDNDGFVIVAGDDRAQPVLAFSTEGAFVTENIPAHIQFFLDGYTEGIQYIIDNQLERDAATHQQWENLLDENAPAPKDGTVVVGPLLGNNQWNQTKYYNDKCPADATGNSAYGGHAAVGCGAIVMGQIMRYWRYPETGTGSHSYNHPNYGTLSANFANTHYNFSAMSDRLVTTFHPDSCVDAVSTLLYHCGVAVNMNYGPAASTANSNYIVSALSTYFRYPTTVQYVERGSISTANWLSHIKEELDEHAPFMYGGSGNYGGHVWTCDGYRDDNYLHFNWGWGGSQNGYYAITSCSSYGFNSNHAVIVGIRGPQLPEAIGENSTPKITVYPNPTDNIVRVTTASDVLKEVQLFDLFGKMLFCQKINENDFTVDLSNYTSGTYILKVVTPEGVETSKIVKY